MRKEEELRKSQAISCPLDSNSIAHLFNEERNHEKCIDAYAPKEVTRLYIPTDYYYDKQKYKINEIGEGVFKNSDKLESVTFAPHSIEKIGDYAFKSCKTLHIVTIAKGLKEIGEEAFKNCKDLETFTLPDILEEIKESAFENCVKLEAVDIPSGITEIGIKTFKNCRKLEIVVIPRSVKTIKSRAFMGCSSLKKLKIEEGVTEIEESAFEDCDKLEVVDIPKSVVTIGEDAFLGVPYLICSEDLQGKGDPWGADFVEWKTSSKKNFNSKIEKSIEEIDIKEIRNVLDKDLVKKLLDNGASTIIIPQTYNDPKEQIQYKINKIGYRAFWDYRGILESIQIPHFIKEIEESAFEGCTKLSFVKIPNGIKNIGKNAFKGVSNIEYYGSAEGSPWGADALNGRPVKSDVQSSVHINKTDDFDNFLYNDFVDYECEQTFDGSENFINRQNDLFDDYI